MAGGWVRSMAGGNFRPSNGGGGAVDFLRCDTVPVRVDFLRCAAIAVGMFARLAHGTLGLRAKADKLRRLWDG